MRSTLAISLALVLAGCGGVEPRSIDTVKSRLDNPTGTIDATSAPKFLTASRDLRLLDTANGVLPYFAPPATLNFYLTEKPSPFTCVQSLAAARQESVEIGGRCLDGEKGDGKMLLAIEREDDLVRQIGIEYQDLCTQGACLSGAQLVSFDLQGFHQAAVASVRAEARTGGKTLKIEAGYRSRVALNDQILWDWTVFLGDQDGAQNVVLSARVDAGAGELVATGENGVWDCHYLDGGSKGDCQPRCDDAELRAGTCCTCRPDQLADKTCPAVCPTSTARRPVEW